MLQYVKHVRCICPRFLRFPLLEMSVSVEHEYQFTFVLVSSGFARFINEDFLLEDTL